MDLDPDKARFQKKSVSLHGHKTSVSLEKAFWDVLEESAHLQGISLSQLLKDIDGHRKGSLSSALRLYVLTYALDVRHRNSSYNSENDL